MGQEFHVLRCFSCQTFQVQQVKKSKKWSCKMCGEKQSLVKVYGQGSGADCRHHVQKLNALRGERLQAEDCLAMMSRQETASEEEQPVDRPICDGDQQVQESKDSCWNKYLSRTDENMAEQVEQEIENVYMDRNGFHTQRKTNSRKHHRTWAAVPREFADPTETCNHWKRAKEQEWDGTHGLQPSMWTSMKTFLPGTLPINKSSVSRQEFPAPQSSAEITSVGDSSYFPRSSESEKRKTSKWNRFLLQARECKTKDEESSCRSGETLATVNVYPSHKLPAGESMSFGDKVLSAGAIVGGSGRTRNENLSFHSGAAPVYQQGLSRQPPYNICSLFQTDEDFDIFL